MTANIVILQLVILGAILESDLGRRKIGWFRLLRPVIAVAAIVPFYFSSLPTAGNDIVLQAAGALAGALLGLISVSPLLVSVSYDTAWRSHRFGAARSRGKPAVARTTGKPAAVSQAGLGYAAIWIAVTVARLWFAYAAQHVFPTGLAHFLISHQLSGTALTNAFIFFSVGMDLFRSVLLWVRGRRSRLAATVPAMVATSTAGEFR